jgi:acyl-CoA synthetase (AMP-forming)/AMP-acid ligase II
MVTAHVLTGPPGDWPTLVPIGSPLPGTELLLGDIGDPDGRVGELLVAGLPVAHGYLNRPELNAERYQAIEPTERGNTRVFRTGDLVRFEDGVVRYLSRLDDDVKLRGIRVNLAEVDAQLMALPEIAAGVAVVVGAAGGPMALRAGVLLKEPGGPFDEDSVLRRLSETLPEVSVPSSLTLLDEVPRAPSGKIDRIAVGKLVAEVTVR